MNWFSKKFFEIFTGEPTKEGISTIVSTPSITLTTQESLESVFTQLAQSLGIPVACLKAVTEIESGSKYRWNQGRIPVLFERHVFLRELTKSKGASFAMGFAYDHPDLCSKKPGGYGSSNDQYAKIAKLIKLGFQEEAYRSASWGAFQIMGNNHLACEFETAKTMVDTLHTEPVEINAIKAFSNFLGSNPKQVTALQHGDYATFARLYNGKNYAINKYDTKIAAAVKKFS